MFAFKVEFYSAYDETELTEYGFIPAVDYGEAATKVTKLYGVDTVISVRLAQMAEDHIVFKEEDKGLYKEVMEKGFY